jgi:type I restriction enzyme S subunit
VTTVLDELPMTQGWSEVPFRAIARKVSEPGYGHLQPLSVYLEAGVVPRSSRDDNHNQLGENIEKYQRVLPDDLVFNKLRTWQGGFGISRDEGIVSPAYIIARPIPGAIDPRFLGYLLKSAPYLAELTRLSKWMPPSQFDISWESIRDLRLRIPAINEQRRIADYLDEQVARLDSLVNSRKKQEVLVDSLANVIREKFLTGPLTKFVPLKRVTSFVYGDALASELRLDGDINVMSSGGISGSHNVANTLGPVVVVGRKGSFGAVHWSDSPAFVIDTAYFIDKRSTSVDLRWLYHVLKISQLSELSVDVGIPGLSREAAYAKRIPNPPPLHEQVSQASSIDRELDNLKSLSENIKLSAKLFADLKTSLITAAVTGTFDVSTGRNVA